MIDGSTGFALGLLIGIPIGGLAIAMYWQYTSFREQSESIYWEIKKNEIINELRSRMIREEDAKKRYWEAYESQKEMKK